MGNGSSHGRQARYDQLRKVAIAVVHAPYECLSLPRDMNS